MRRHRHRQAPVASQGVPEPDHVLQPSAADLGSEVGGLGVGGIASNGSPMHLMHSRCDERRLPAATSVAVACAVLKRVLAVARCRPLRAPKARRQQADAGGIADGVEGSRRCIARRKD